MKLYKLALIALVAVGLTLPGCKSKDDPEPIPESFPKTQLIEEFTGQACGYCPRGMDEVRAYMDANPNYILVMHHTYYTDNFTVAGSKEIAAAMLVNSAPKASINRVKTKSSQGNHTTFNPIYISSVNPDQFATTTYASVDIANEYDPDTRLLSVKVSGAIAKTDAPALKLTVLVKESGMIRPQQDNYKTFEGWEEFRHTNAVRAFLSEPLGTQISVTNQRYQAQFDLQLNKAWKPENCMVVAFLTEDFQPVVQAAEKPVVDGTKGGADITHGGIKAYDVPDYYPEPNANDGPADIAGHEIDTLDVSLAYYRQFPDYNITQWIIQAYNQNATSKVDGTTSFPFTQLFLLLPYSATPSLPVGTFPVNLTEQPQTLIAGYRNDSLVQIDGSAFYFCNLSYFKQNYLVPTAQWLIADGEATFAEDGWNLTGHTRNGSDIRLVGKPLVNKGNADSAPARIHPRVP